MVIPVMGIARHSIDYTIYSSEAQTTENSTLYKVGPTWPIEQFDQKIDSPFCTRSSQSFCSTSFYQIADIAIRQQSAQSISRVLSQFCLLRILIASQAS